MRLVAYQHATTFGIVSNPTNLDAVGTLAAVIHITGGHPWSAERLQARMHPIVDLLGPEAVIIGIARDRLVARPGDLRAAARDLGRKAKRPLASHPIAGSCRRP
jgi:hypothetical protein